MFEIHDLVNAFVVCRQFAVLWFSDDHEWLGFLNRHGRVTSFRCHLNSGFIFVDCLHPRILLLTE